LPKSAKIADGDRSALGIFVLLLLVQAHDGRRAGLGHGQDLVSFCQNRIPLYFPKDSQPEVWPV
jgi:hypothetical protein